MNDVILFKKIKALEDKIVDMENDKLELSMLIGIRDAIEDNLNLYTDDTIDRYECINRIYSIFAE